LSALIGNLDRIESFKASSHGIEARTRQIVDKAENALKELHQLAAMTGTILVQQIVGSGRWGGTGSAKEKDAQKEQVLRTLRSVGLPDGQVNEM
jgi:hypothetical protein